MKLTKSNLGKIEIFLGELGYKVRYEKGSFKSGYCLVEERNIIVINKFFDTESRINKLIDIIAGLDANTTGLTPKSKKVYRSIIESIQNAISD